MEDDIYVLVSCWKCAPPSESFPFSVALFVYYAAAGGAAGLNLAICGTAGYLKKSQYLHGNNSSSVSPKTTFGDEANNILSACWQKSREMVYEGPREGSQAKPQHFPQTAPLVLFLLLAVVVVTLTRPLICTQTPFRFCSVKFTAPIKCRKCRWGWCEKEEEDGKNCVERARWHRGKSMETKTHCDNVANMNSVCFLFSKCSHLRLTRRICVGIDGVFLSQQREERLKFLWEIIGISIHAFSIPTSSWTRGGSSLLTSPAVIGWSRANIGTSLASSKKKKISKAS